MAKRVVKTDRKWIGHAHWHVPVCIVRFISDQSLPHFWPSRWYMYTTSSIRNIWDLEDICALPTRHVIMCIKSVMAWPNISFLLEINLFLIHYILFHFFLCQVFTRVIKLQDPIVIFLRRIILIVIFNEKIFIVYNLSW